MIVDVITNGIHRVHPVVHTGAEEQHIVSEMYTAANSHLICQYADAELCDIRAFGLTSGFVRVMGGMRAAQLPGVVGAVIPVPAAPRVYTFYVNEPVVSVAFSPDGLTLGVLYRSCLVVVANDTRRVFYFGQNHVDTFEKLYMSEEFVYVTTTTDEILKFNLIGPAHDLTRLSVPRAVRVFLSETDEWVVYDDVRRMIVFGDGEQVLVPAMVGTIRKLVPTLDRDRVWALSDTELVLVSRAVVSAAVVPIQIQIAPTEDVLVLPFQMGLMIGWYEEPTRMLHLKSFEFVQGPGVIVQTGSVSVPFQTAPRALALPAGPFTRFNTAHPVMVMQRLTRADVVFNQHLFPEADSESDADSETETDDESGDDVDDVVAVSFNYPQPLTGLQLIIRRTRDYLPALCESFVHWTPAQFETVLKAAYAFARPIRVLNQEAAMLLYAKENHKVFAQVVEETVRKFADYYGGSPTMGLLDGSSDIPFEPYAAVQNRVQPTECTQDPSEAERVLMAHLRFSDTTIGERLELETQEFRVDMAYHLATQFRGIEADTIHAVNTGIISTLNCKLTEVYDLIASIAFQRKLMKIVSRALCVQTPTGPDDVTTGAKRGFTGADDPPSKKLSGGV